MDDKSLTREQILRFLSDFAKSTNLDYKLLDVVYALWVTCLNNETILNTLKKYLDTEIQKTLQQLIQQINWKKVFEYFPDFELNDFYKNRVGCKPKTSIIVPVFNVSSYLRECLDSIVSQTYENIEILCVNDAIKDDNNLILKGYQSQCLRKLTLIETTNKGLSSVRNTALDNATGYYVYFVNPEDTIRPDTVEQLVNVINSEVDFVVHGTEVISLDAEYKCQASINNQLLDNSVQNEAMHKIDKEFASNITHVVWDKLYKLRYFSKYNIRFKPIIGEDEVFVWEYLIHCSRYYFLDQKLYYYRRCENGFMWKRLGAVEALDRIRVYSEISKVLKRNHKLNNFFTRLVTFFIVEVGNLFPTLPPKDFPLVIVLINQFIWKDAPSNRRLKNFYWQIVRKLLPALIHQ